MRHGFPSGLCNIFVFLRQQTNFFGVDSSVPKMCQAHNIEEKTSSRKEGGRVSLEHFLLVCMLTCKAAKFTAKRGSELNLEFWIG